MTTTDPHATPTPRFSIVICTDGRAKSLANTLSCLRFLDGPEYEVCVVRGPTEDGTADVLAQWHDCVKVTATPIRNLSRSRNLGIAMATGDIVAFLDDDALPEPHWLIDLAAAFADPKVAGAGGFVMDHTGARAQYTYSSADRLGNSDWSRQEPASNYNFPYSFHFPYLQGTNAAFRRDVLLSIGGFDEEYEFYLDETDVCCRVNDAGWKLRQLANAVVHHKFLPSAIRTPDRVTRARYSVLKNKLYFSLVNNCGHYTVKRAVDDMFSFVRDQEKDLRDHIAGGRLSPGDLDRFWADEQRAWDVGMTRGLSGDRRLIDPGLLSSYDAPFLNFRRLIPSDERNTFAFISQEYPPGRPGGTGRHVSQLARSIASIGHHVHVFTRGEDHDRLDFEDGVWVHRVAPRELAAVPPAGTPIPRHIWQYAMLMLEEVRRLDRRQRVDAVYAPIWDCEGAAVLLDGHFPLVTALQTTLHFWLQSHDHSADQAYMRDFARPMLALEGRLFRDSQGVHAISESIRHEVARAYGVTFDSSRTATIPLALDDFSRLPETSPQPLPEGAVRVLFLGRLEARKGIDVLLHIAPNLLKRHPDLYFDIVGNDTILGPKGITYREEFETTISQDERTRVQFHGEVSEDRLRGFYRACDIFVAPSRFESFGQVLLEAMIYGKPVVACRAGGMVEVVDHERTGLLAEPDDASSLEECLERLVVDPDLRRLFGESGRRRYQDAFSPNAAAEGVIALLRTARERMKTMTRVQHVA